MKQAVGFAAVGASIVMMLLVFSAPLSAASPPGVRQIAFVSSVKGSDQIFAIYPDGSGLVRVTSFAGTPSDHHIKTVAWSPDGSSLTFELDGKTSGYQTGVWIVNADGTGIEYIGEGGSPSWSPDGRSLALSMSAVGDKSGLPTTVIATLEIATGTRTVVTDPTDENTVLGEPRSASDRLPVWTPDGSSIVYVTHNGGTPLGSNDAIFSVNIATGRVKFVVAVGGHISDLDVRQDGETVIYQDTTLTHPSGFPYLSETRLADGSTTPINVPDPATTSTGVSYGASDGTLATTLTSPWFDAPDIAIRDTAGSWRTIIAGRSPAWQPVEQYHTGLAGADRFATAVAVSQHMYPNGAERVYIVNGYRFPDALAASSGLPGPVLLVQPDTVPATTITELQRLTPTTIYVIGGTQALTSSVVTQLERAGPWTVTRLAGADRFATAVAVSQHMYPNGAERVYIVNGYRFPDALAASSGLPGPVLLVQPDTVPATTITELQRLTPTTIYVIGGTQALTSSVVTQLERAGPWTVTRLAGADRFATAVAVSQHMYPNGAERVYIVNGYRFPDALAASSGLPGPVLLVQPDTVPATTITELQRLTPTTIYVIGGRAAISHAALTDLTSARP